MAAIDVRSADLVLIYTADDELGAAGAPPHDLSGNDVGRLAYRRAIDRLGDAIGRPIDPADPDEGVVARPDPEQPDSAIVSEILDELVASGRYEAASKPRAVPKSATHPDEPIVAAENAEG